jgi:hypothetical protein
MTVLNSPELASEILPTSSGFFFGSNDYDDYYFNQLRNTLDQIDRIFKDQEIMKDIDENKDVKQFVYQASW